MSFHRYVEPEIETYTVPVPGMRAAVVKHNYVPSPPVGTYVAMVFRVAGHDRDADGSAMMRLACVNRDGSETGWAPNCIGAYPDTDVIVDHPQDLWDAIEDDP